MSDAKHINENELDGLLREFSLDTNSELLNEAEAQFVLSQDYDAIIDPKKEKQLLDKLDPGKKSGYWKWFLIIGAALLLSVFVYYWLYPSGSSAQLWKERMGELKNESALSSSDSSKTIKTSSTLVQVKLNDTFGKEKFIPMVAYSDSTKDAIQHEPITEVENDPVTVPILTEKDRSRYRNIKEQILRKIIKMDKGFYTHVPSYKLNYKGKNTVVDGFSIRNVCVTNLEYKAFLADLITQKRSEDYLKAQVQSENWIKTGYALLANTYFQDERYNDFPVVNITKKGGELFCKWLQEELKLYVQKNKLKFPELTIRLPYDDEAIFAAREGYTKISFNEGYNTIYDESENLVDHTFTKRAELSKKRVKRIDTLYHIFTTNKYGWKENELMEFYSKGFNYYRNVPGDSIFSDRMKVLSKVGRVSEITVQKNSATIWLSGLTWENKAQYLKLDSEFKTNGSSPFVGFKVVLIDPNDPEYKNPFW